MGSLSASHRLLHTTRPSFPPRFHTGHLRLYPYSTPPSASRCLHPPPLRTLTVRAVHEGIAHAQMQRVIRLLPKPVQKIIIAAEAACPVGGIFGPSVPKRMDGDPCRRLHPEKGCKLHIRRELHDQRRIALGCHALNIRGIAKIRQATEPEKRKRPPDEPSEDLRFFIAPHFGVFPF